VLDQPAAVVAVGSMDRNATLIHLLAVSP